MSSLFQRAADATACAMLNDIGSASTQLAAWTMWTPKAALVPLTVGALSYMANNLLCNEMDFPDNGNDDRLEGCRKGSDPDGYPVQYKAPSGDYWGNAAIGYVEILEVQYVFRLNGTWGHRLLCRNASGEVIGVHGGKYATEEEAIQYGKYRLNVPAGECEQESNPDDPGDPYPDFEPYTYEDPVTNCNYTLVLQGFVQQSQGGPIQPVYQISSSGNGGTSRAGGGVMGGCNLAPTIIVHNYEDGGGGGGGGIPVPVPTPPNPDGQPWWLQPLITTLTTTLLNQLLNALNDTNQTPMAAGSFTLTAPCDVDAEGNPAQATWTFDKQPWYQRVHDQQVVIMDILQQHLDWKTPICREQRPQPEGTWISTRWISDGNSPGGERPLRKLFRYRSKSTLTDEQLREYWADFVWEAGPVCVIHKGAWWGTPQVWASTAEEGQRVIRRAGAEAGLDPDQAGEWLTRSSDSSRYGMPGTMRLEAPNGTRWVTRREGPSAVPS